MWVVVMSLAAAPPRSRAVTSEDGFTLLEVIVALAILSLSMVVVLQVLSQSAARTRDAEMLTRARILAQSLLEEVGSVIPVNVGVLDGEGAGGLRWRVLQKRYSVSRKATGVQLIEVTSEVSWGNYLSNRSISISSLRVGSIP